MRTASMSPSTGAICQARGLGARTGRADPGVRHGGVHRQPGLGGLAGLHLGGRAGSLLFQAAGAVVIADVDAAAVPAEISRINYIFFTGNAPFDERVDELAHALNTDVEWLKEHTRLGELGATLVRAGTPEGGINSGQGPRRASAWAARRRAKPCRAARCCWNFSRRAARRNRAAEERTRAGCTHCPYPAAAPPWSLAAVRR